MKAKSGDGESLHAKVAADPHRAQRSWPKPLDLLDWPRVSAVDVGRSTDRQHAEQPSRVLSIIAPRERQDIAAAEL
jgi:hypothetical protein